MYRINFSIDGDSFEYDTVDGMYSNNPDYSSCSHAFEEIAAAQSELFTNVESLCFTISVTDECNLRCTYCFENHANHYISTDTIQAITGLIEKCVSTYGTIERVVVIWFGGEPMLNLDYILFASKSFIQTCDKAQVQYISKIISNGIYIDRILPHVSEIQLNEIQITLDGTKDAHDSRRVGPEGIGTYDRIVRNLTKIFNMSDVIIRINISEENVDDAFILCDELLDIIPTNIQTRVYFQPTLVEDYSKLSKFRTSIPKTNYYLLDKYVSLLEYSGTLITPRFIYSHCNISVPGSLFIRADGSLCKCWAQATRSNPRGRTINDDMEQVMRYVVTGGAVTPSKVCRSCDIFPSCLGGCSAVSRNSESCLAKRQLSVASILRGYILRQAKDNLHYAILRNELQWFESIGCRVSYRQNGIKVSRTSLSCNSGSYYDFNFFIGHDAAEECLRLSQRASSAEADFSSVVGYKREDVYDINYFMFTRPKDSSSFSADITISPVSLNHWIGTTTSRVRSRNCSYYHILLKGAIIGFFSLVYTDIVGIYDFEIIPLYRSKGYGQKSLLALCSLIDAQFYIQTWSNNDSARKCYEAVGFKTFEVLIRYTRDS